jgi:deoxyribonuclease-4
MKSEFQRIIGLEKLSVIHLNDSKKELGSRVDCHDHIGKGRIGLEGFRHIMNESAFSRIPKILETPKGKDNQYDRRNLSALRGLKGNET